MGKTPSNSPRDDDPHPSRFFTLAQMSAVLAFHVKTPSTATVTDVIEQAEKVLLGVSETLQERCLIDRAATCYDLLYATSGTAKECSAASVNMSRTMQATQPSPRTELP